MAARIYFNIPGSAPASFPSPVAGGYAPGLGNGLQANAIYLTDSDSAPTPISTIGPSDPNWPQWISSVELGLSGAANPAAPNPDCARFSSATDIATPATCSGVNCGAPAANMFRISEHDCQSVATAGGNGTANDPIYVRAVFNRANLGVSENIMAVLEYASSGLYTAPSDPTQCFNAGVLNVSNSNCSDMNWNVFLQPNLASLSGAPSPFMILIPPTSGFINRGNPPGTPLGSAQILTKQIVLPIAANPNLTTLQFSRISALPAGDADFAAICTADSPLCLGVILYSLTFYRI
jgi:hypothetical protein